MVNYSLSPINSLEITTAPFPTLNRFPVQALAHRWFRRRQIMLATQVSSYPFQVQTGQCWMDAFSDSLTTRTLNPTSLPSVWISRFVLSNLRERLSNYKSSVHWRNNSFVWIMVLISNELTVGYSGTRTLQNHHLIILCVSYDCAKSTRRLIERFRRPRRTWHHCRLRCNRPRYLLQRQTMATRDWPIRYWRCQQAFGW